uniref:thiopurine S-methyltransferase n=1 Tax=Phallusia mammillata TaxID=59560 RepID=A0A6F9DVN0_9ASCI|nr:thiopurine S-methyltransferase-like [Phallusia mammillata]
MYYISMTTDNNTSRSDVQRNEMSLQSWDGMWNENFIPFHESKVHKDLLKHENTLISHPGRIFVPLCGKTVDMKYLYDQGHSVVGMEFSDKAIVQFFEENQIQFEKNDSKFEKFHEYKSLDGKVSLYAGDIFNVDAENLGRFDAIWDRGSFVAINVCDQEKYARIVTNLLKHDGKYLLNAFTYDGSKYQGPPHTSSEVDVMQRFGPYCDVTLLDTYDGFKPYHKNWGLDSFLVCNYLLQLKQGSANL